MITIFEKFQKVNYSEGDYVIIEILEPEIIKFLDSVAPENDNIAMIININNTNFHLYEVRFNNGYHFNIGDSEIKRNATAEEVYSYEAKMKANKYNL
jgi:hypothetical protein